MTKESRSSESRIAKGILHKSLYFIAIRHRYALFFALGTLLFCTVFTVIGIPYWMAHQAAMSSVSQLLSSHPLLILFSHILMLIAIYFGFSVWIHARVEQDPHNEEGQDLHAEEAEEAALRFLRIVMAAAVVLMIAGHFAS